MKAFQLSLKEWSKGHQEEVLWEVGETYKSNGVAVQNRNPKKNLAPVGNSHSEKYK